MNANSVVYLASYKGKGGFIDRAIRWLVKGKYSHSEIFIVSNHSVIGVTSAGTEGGVRSKQYDHADMNLSDWDLIKLPFVNESTVWDWYFQNMADKYDWWGVIRFMFPWSAPQHKSAWFCSECCADIIGFNDAWRYDPSTLHDAVLRLNHGR